ncbi:MAG: glycoside hydrolase family 3 N-terminal domain-containing protein [Bacteroidales bacterium]
MAHIGLALAVLCSFIPGQVNNQTESREKMTAEFEAEAPPFVLTDTVRMDSVVNRMSLDEKIGQLFMVAAYSNKDKQHEDYIESLVKEHHIGGLIFMQGGPKRQLQLLERYQNAAETPLMIAMDAEWGPSMRLDTTVFYPRQMMLGAIRDNQLLYEAGAEYARQLKSLGVHINFAPVVDVNVNPENPVINSRSYGEDREEVFRKAYYFSRGMQDNHVLAVAKHFPGHGDTDKDSHKALPIIPHDIHRLDSIELYPFRKLINAGIGGVMVAHLFVPELDPVQDRASTLSPQIVNELLIKDMGFDGLVFTDALNMHAVTDHYEPGETEVLACKAGNDVLLFPQDVPRAVESIKAAINDGSISEEEINTRVKKILAAKSWMGLKKDSTGEQQEEIYKSLMSPRAKAVQRNIVEHAITLVDMKDSLLPVKNLSGKEMASLDLGSELVNSFQIRLKDYAHIPAYVYQRDVKNFGKQGLIDELAEKDIVFVSLTATHRLPTGNFGFDTEEKNVITRLSKRTNVVFTLFGNPYALGDFQGIDDLAGLVVAYNDREMTQDVSAQMIFGGLAYQGKLPVGINENYPAGTGIITEKVRLGYTSVPEQVGINSAMFTKVDSLVQEAINERATPGAQILAARKGKVFFHKCYGHHTYQKKHIVRPDDIYDLASVTKIVASTVSMMHLYDRAALRLNDRLGDHLTWLDGSNKGSLMFKDILTHQARLKPWIPFYVPTIEPGSYPDFYADSYSEKTDHQVADHMYAIHSIRDSILQDILESELRSRKAYKYSDLGFYLIREFIEEETGYPLDKWVDSVFYQPLGATTMGYNPLRKFPASGIVPTENDRIFRKQILRGYVHDQGAAMLGGVSGHAGVFSNAGDLAKMMQMLLNKGSYGGEQFIHPETVELFTRPLQNPSENRRGLGFDKPSLDDPEDGPSCVSASPESFGHAGFTGILAWVDPKTDILYVFLSNRVYPDMDNKKLLKLDTRTNVQDVFYRAIMEEE